jgi:hypothetical protein
MFRLSVTLTAGGVLLAGCQGSMASSGQDNPRDAGNDAAATQGDDGAPDARGADSAPEAQGPDDATAPYEALWARTALSMSMPTASLSSSVATDGTGNAYVAGEFWGPGTLDFGNGVTVTGGHDGAIALLLKYDPSGSAQWAQTVGASSSNSQFSSLTVDSAGNVYVAGFVRGPGSVDLGNGVTVTVTNSGTINNALLVKYNASGTAQWAQMVAGSSDSDFGSVAVDFAGDVVVAGEIDGIGRYDFGNGVSATGTATSDAAVQIPSNAVLAKYSSSGIAQWGRTVVSGSPGSSFASVALDSVGNAYAAGSIGGTGTYDFGNGVAVSGTSAYGAVGGQAAGNAVLVKFSASGIPQWAQTTVAGSSGSNFWAAAVDSAGDVYAAGAIGGPQDTYNFGNGVTVAGPSNTGFTGTAGPQYAVLVNYDSSGSARWARSLVDTSGPNSLFSSLAVDSSGDVYAAGAVNGGGTYNFGNGAAIPILANTQNVNHVALIKYDLSGTARWARSSTNGGGVDDTFQAVAVVVMGDVYAAGGVGGGAGAADFGNNVAVASTVVPGIGWNALLVKYR